MATRIPVATYRLQLNRDFPFAAAADQVDYLDALGVTDVYASPILAARPGSNHGYDVVDPTRLNPDLGPEADLGRLAERLRARAMGLLLDVVPNHMCIADPGNVWWSDVLENGPGSPHAGWFDVDWHPPKPELKDRVLLPFLGDQYGRVLEDGALRVAYQEGAFLVRYGPLVFPLAPRTTTMVLEPALAALRERHGLDEKDPRVLELESIITALRHLPRRTEIDPERVRERRREKEIAKRRLDALVSSPGGGEVRVALEAELAAVNGRRGDPRSFDRLEALLAEQAYRLSSWHVASDEINYRRFFDINDLAAVRVEGEEVFAAVHRLVFEYVRRGWVTGLRVDHVDGLYDPVRYLEDLQRGCGEATTGSGFYVVVEKILEPGERLRERWATQGTTGYDFLNLVNGIFVDPAGAGAVRDFYGRFAGQRTPFDELLYQCKRFILGVSLSSEIHVLGRELDRISEQHRYSRDFTRNGLYHALGTVVASFPVYRTYIRAEEGLVDDEDRRHVDLAIAASKRRNPATAASIFDWVRSVLLLDDPEGLSEAQVAARRRFVMRVQQLTGPVMAKGLEDTSFYRHYPLASLDEVGGRPDRTGVPLEEFHAACAARLASWPHALSATATHDTKRGEDLRLRIDALSEIPEEWARAVERWHAQNRDRRTLVGGAPAPDANEEYLLYQTLVGIWPPGGPGASGEAERARLVERVLAYVNKALKEAKVHTSWINPNDAYDRAVRDFVRAVLDPRTGEAFQADLAPFAERVARAGMLASLAQTLVKVVAPGVPDFYQGTELWDLSLVDPDNRRPVDFAGRRALLDALRAGVEADRRGLVRRLIAAPEDGRVKLFVTSEALRFRRANRDLFERGAYVPLEARGARAGHVIAFARVAGERAAVALAGRFFLKLGPPGARTWGDTEVALPAGRRFRDAFTGRELRVEGGGGLRAAEAFAEMPVALLERLS